MAMNVKEYLMEAGMGRELAQELHEIALSMKLRLERMQQTGVEKSLVLLDLGKYRRIEQRSPQNLQQLHRLNLDLALLVVRFTERCRLMEQVGLIQLNPVTGDYEFTALGQQLTQGSA